MYPLPATKFIGPVLIPQLVFCALLSCTVHCHCGLGVAYYAVAHHSIVLIEGELRGSKLAEKVTNFYWYHII